MLGKHFKMDAGVRQHDELLDPIPLVRRLAEHHETATVGRIAARKSGFSAHGHLS
jgi:hypothetical protein